jgi:hypothetical protein
VTKIDGAAVEAVWNAWRDRQKRPHLCRFTKDRRELIAKRLALGYLPEDLVALIRYAHEANERGPRWWRGENPDRVRYLDLSNLLVERKLGARVQAALEWADRGAQEPAEPPPVARRGALALYRGGRS